jgi:hypothetical protein
MTLHMHEDVQSRDCDGGHACDYTITEYAGETGRLAWSAYMAHVIRFHGLFGTEPGQTIERWTDVDGLWHIEYGGRSEEGFRRTHAYTCDDDWCTPGYGRVWDQFAEAAGY